jgi:cobalt-precorrin 5A hydrolase
MVSFLEIHNASMAMSADTGRTALLTLSVEGARLAAFLKKRASETGDSLISDAELYIHKSVPSESDWENAIRFEAIKDAAAEVFPQVKNIIGIMPLGVVIRSIAPLITNKLKDPAVVVLDVVGRWAVSLLSGHEGGANELAVRLSGLCGAEPIVTTTTDAKRTIIAGIGCRKGVSYEAVIAALRESLKKAQVSIEDVRLLASPEAKRQEKGLHEAARILERPLIFIPHAEINRCMSCAPSEAAQRHLGLRAAAEPCALLGGRRTQCLSPKIKKDGVTIALARENYSWSVWAPEESPIEQPPQ